jgi:hypothetical protein
MTEMDGGNPSTASFFPHGVGAPLDERLQTHLLPPITPLVAFSLVVANRFKNSCNHDSRKSINNHDSRKSTNTTSIPVYMETMYFENKIDNKFGQ